MKKLFLVILIILLVPVVGLAYLGFVPGISKFVAKPKDLGIKSDPSLVAAIEQKYSMKNEVPGGVVPAGRLAEFSGSVKFDSKLSSEEITSILAYWKHRSPSLPIRDVQVRFSSDGTGEISGILEVGTAISIAKTLGYNDSDIEKGKSYAKYVSGDLPFYVKGTGGVKSNQITLYPSTFELGKVTIPESITAPAAKVVEDVIERRLKQVPGLDIQSADFKDGSFHLVGTLPDKVK